MLESYIIILCKGDNFKYIFRRLMMDKRKSQSKCPYQHRRSRRSTLDLLFPYLLGPKLFVSPPMLTVQTMPVYSTSRSGSSLNNASPFITGYASFVDSIAPLDSNLVWSLQTLVCHTLNLMLLKIFQLGQQHSLSFHCKWIGPGLQGLVPLT